MKSFIKIMVIEKYKSNFFSSSNNKKIDIIVVRFLECLESFDY